MQRVHSLQFVCDQFLILNELIVTQIPNSSPGRPTSWSAATSVILRDQLTIIIAVVQAPRLAMRDNPSLSYNSFFCQQVNPHITTSVAYIYMQG